MALEAVNGVYEVVRNTGATLQTTLSIDGAAHDADGAVTVTITRADGTVLVNAQPAAHGGTGVYTSVLAPQANLDLLTVAWSGVFSGVAMTVAEVVELVGDVYVALTEIKAMRHLPAAITNSELIEMRRDFEDLAERYVGVALVPRFQRDVLVGTGRTHVQLTKRRPRRVLSVSIDGVAVSDVSGYTTAKHGRLQNVTAGFTRGATVIVQYEHGRDHPSAAVTRGCKAYIEHQGKVDNGVIGRDVLYETDSAGITTRFSTPDWDAGRPTGLFDVDRTLNAVRRSEQTS